MYQVVLSHGYTVNIKRIRRLYHLMGIEAIYPKPKLSFGSNEHVKYPYLLKDVEVKRPDQVWSTDITYIPMVHGFLYLVAIIEKPEIFNSDQGCQFTSQEFTSVLDSHNIKISMDGCGRVFDNIFIERLWRSLKYEDIYLHSYSDGQQLWDGLDRYFHFFNWERPHQSLNYQTPGKVYEKKY